MTTKWFLLIGMMGLLIMATACSPASQGQEVTTIQDNKTTTEVIPVPQDTSNEAGNAEPGVAQGGDENEPGSSNGQPTAGAPMMYTDDTYKFSVEYPSNFTFRVQTADKLATLEPKPLTAFLFINPVAASSDIADLEPADLEIRVYDPKGATSLEQWLASVKLNGDGFSSKEFKTNNISGLKVCVSTMIFPGCSYFVMNNNRVYQLITVTLEGEDMFNSFTFVP
jgi:hypothetical protein